jgi:hypothetical protein
MKATQKENNKMTAFDFLKNIQALTPDVVSSIGVTAVQQNGDQVIKDAINANLQGLTFAGNPIDEVKPFSDWYETGEFHNNLTFLSANDIQFTSKGDGFAAIEQAFNPDDTIAPSAVILQDTTMQAIKQSFINILTQTI